MRPLSVVEGERVLMAHLRYERRRSRAIVEAKKHLTLQATGRLACEVCGFDFAITYGSLGQGFCEVHHVKHWNGNAKGTHTTMDDLAILCSNCHSIIHRSVRRTSIDELKKVVERRRRKSASISG
jgi:5-methylcytosine-specific restriction protein A